MRLDRWQTYVQGVTDGSKQTTATNVTGLTWRGTEWDQSQLSVATQTAAPLAATRAIWRGEDIDRVLLIGLRLPGSGRAFDRHLRTSVLKFHGAVGSSTLLAVETPSGS
ncbi:hypothetical protein GCM10023318_04980 [Nocardia callitridis]|uniref:Uncharacterized protein n=1 Tax=Nocardia callitridis TaxID=648753 RepID=A0ABP9JTW7_9NOCA